jgi:hypothetical protein
MPIHRPQTRIDQTDECFTPKDLVQEMLSLLNDRAWGPEQTFLDPAAGDGNMLVVFLEEKLKRGHDPIQALSTIYGADIMEDNVKHARRRMAEVVWPLLNKEERLIAAFVLKYNIFWVKDSLTFDWNKFQSLEEKGLFAIINSLKGGA